MMTSDMLVLFFLEPPEPFSRERAFLGSTAAAYLIWAANRPG